MIKLRTDIAAEPQPQVQRAGKRNGMPLMRVYINHRTEEQTDEPEEGKEPSARTVYVADFIECESEKTTAADIAREAVEQAIREHDASDAVNRFTIGGVPMWLDKSTRTGLRMRLDAEDNAGKTETTLWYGRYSVMLSVRQAMEMLLELELYASRCYDRTQEHLAAVADMDRPERLLAYDYTTGYPEMLEF